MLNLLLTKLRQPVLPPKWVSRAYLTHRLNEGFNAGRPFTLVSAPAGFGKTTCVAEWAQMLDCPVAWLSLDLADDDPARFFAYLLATLQPVDAGIGAEIAPLLRAGQLPPGDVLSAALGNDMLRMDGRFLLILDDFHVIQEPFILQVLQQLVGNMPPALHLALLTREEPSLPLARLRANNLMTEIRAADLRFSDADVAGFLNEVLGLSLSLPDVTALAEKTEGWIAGLQLAALSLRGRKNPSQFIATLSGSHRHILSYLTEEVLSRQPAEVQTFLLQTSILDRLNGDLCDAVTKRDDGRFLLESFVNDNLFLLPLDDEQQWYRYHHLFAGLLRDRLMKLHREETAVLHQRAAHWYAQAGMPAEAIDHALTAQDYETAVHLIENHATRLIMQWYVKTVKAWMQALPPEWIVRSPKATLAFAWTHLMHGDFTQAAPYLERLQAMFADSRLAGDPALQAEWLALQAMLLNAQGQPEQGLALGQQSLALVPPPEDNVRGLIYLGLAGAYQQMEASDQAMAAYRQMIRHGRAANNLTTELLGVSGLALLALQHGQLHLALETAWQGVERIEHSGTLPPISTAVYGELGEVYYQWHQLEKAHVYFQRATQVSALSGYSEAEIYHAVVRSRLAQIEGDLETAVAAIRQAVEQMQVMGLVVVQEEVVAQQVRIHLAQHQLAAAEAALQQYGFIWPDQTNGDRPGLLSNSVLRVLLYRAEVKQELAGWQQSIAWADRLLAAALERGYLPLALETLLLRARMHTKGGDEAAGLADVARALELAEPEGFITVFVAEGEPVAAALAQLLRNRCATPEFVQKTLAAFPEDVRITENRPLFAEEFSGLDEALVEPLTRRELEILHLIEAGLSNQKIAARLSITLHTVKKHTSNIYAKLRVKSRTQAVARASQLHLL